MIALFKSPRIQFRPLQYTALTYRLHSASQTFHIFLPHIWIKLLCTCLNNLHCICRYCMFTLVYDVFITCAKDFRIRCHNKDGLLVYLGLLNYKDTKEKFCHLKKLTCKGTLRQVFFCLRPPSLLGFCLGWWTILQVLNIVRYRVLLHNMVSNRLTSHHPPPPPSHTLPVYSVLWHRKGGTRERVRGATQSWVENTNMTDYISSL